MDFVVIASPWVRPQAGPKTGSAKQSRWSSRAAASVAVIAWRARQADRELGELVEAVIDLDRAAGRFGVKEWPSPAAVDDVERSPAAANGLCR